MPFDPSTADPSKPVVENAKFDPSTAKAVPIQEKIEPIDFDTGLSHTDRMALAQADNPAEQESYLKSVYGNAVGKDKDGTLFVNIKGKKIAASGGGLWSGLADEMMANAPTLAGAAYGAYEGAAIGAAGGPWGVGLGALGGAAIGAMTGKGIIEGEKVLTGRYRKDLKQYGQVMLDTGIGGMEGEAGGQIAGKVAGRLVHGKLPKVVTQTSEENEQMTERILGEQKFKPSPTKNLLRRAAGKAAIRDSSPGNTARPNAQGILPGLKHIQFMQALSRKAVGAVRKQDESNANYIRQRMAKMLYDSGHSPAEVEATLKAMDDNSALIPTAQVGEDVRKAVQAHQTMLGRNVEERAVQADREVTSRVEKLNKHFKEIDSEGLASDSARAISSAKRDFDVSMSKGFAKVDDLVAGRKVVPLKNFVETARDISGRLFKGQQAGAVKEASKMGKEETADSLLLQSLGVEKPSADAHGMISFQDAHRMMSQLREQIGTGLNKNIRQTDLMELADSLDSALRSAARNPVAKPAVEELRRLMELQDKGNKKFEDTTVKYLHSLMEHGIPPDPEAVAAQILKPGNSERVDVLKKLLGPENWKKVVGADYTNLMSGSMDEFGNIDGARLLAQLNKRGPQLETIYEKFAGDLKELAHLMAARDGRLSVEELAPTNAKLTLENLKKEEAALDDFMKNNAVSELADPKRNPEQAYEWLAHPNHSTELAKAIKLLGNGHPALEGVRRAALKQVLSETKMQVAETGRGAGALTKAINKYSPAQQEQLFPGGLADDIKLLGKETDILMASLSDESKAGFASGAILAIKPAPIRWAIQIPMGIYQTILAQPKVIRYMALGLRAKNSYTRQNTKAMLRTLIRYGYLPSGQAEEPQHVDEDESTNN